MTLTQTEVELGDPVAEVRGPQPEVEGRKGDIHTSTNEGAMWYRPYFRGKVEGGI